MRNSNAKLIMLEHSKAKVELYATYLATYLNILSRVPFINRIHIYDLMCGEGVYVGGSKGSPVIAMEKIKDHYFSNKKVCPDIEVWFNDKDKSEIEKERYKIERVKEQCSKIFRPGNVSVTYTHKDYKVIYPEIIKRNNALARDERLLLFLDPYGYKEIKPEHLRQFLSSGKTELILFLPISFMSRIASKSLSEDEFPGGKPLQEFLTPLFEPDKDLIISSKPYLFISQLKLLLKDYLNESNILVDTFTIERDKQNVYCLFFFTPNVLGFEKMLEAKWKIDEQQGMGFRLNYEQGSLFTKIQVSDYPNKLKRYIYLDDRKTNADLYIFGLKNGFLPKHTNQILKDWQTNDPNFRVYFNEGHEARRGAFYISYKNFGSNPEKVVNFSFKVK